MLSMWQMGIGSKEFRFQTDEPELKNKMQRRNKFRLVGRGMNCNVWIFQAEFYRPDKARNTFKALKGKKPIWVEKEALFYAD